MSNLSNNLSNNLLNSIKALLVVGFFILSFSLVTAVKAQEIVTSIPTLTGDLVISPITYTPQIPAPTLEVNDLDDYGRVAGEIIISGSALNFSQVEIYLDGSLAGEAPVEEGPTGFGDYEFTLPRILCYCQHKIEAVTKYFNNTKSVPTSFVFTYIKKFPAPTLFEPVLNSETNYTRPWITGLAFNDSLIEIYIDNHLDGVIEVENSENNVASFRYKPDKKLDFGFHIARAIAINKYDLRTSTKSNEVIFEIRPYGAAQKMQAPDLAELPEDFIPPVPAPTLLAPKSGRVSSELNPLVAGVVKNNHLVKISVDGKLDGKFMPEDHSSGTAYFEYKIQNNLIPGVHKISSIAINPRGEISGNSNILQILTITGQEKVFFSSAPEIDKGASSQILGEQEQETLKQESEVGEQEINRNWLRFIWIVIIITGLLVILALFFERKRIKGLLKKSKEKENGEKVEIRTREKKGQVVEEPKISEPKPSDDFSIPSPPPDAPDNNSSFGF